MLKLWRLYSRFTESLHHPELLLMLGSRDLKRLRKKTRWKEGLPQPQMIKTSCRWGIWWKWIAEKQSTPSLFQSWPKIEVSVSFLGLSMPDLQYLPDLQHFLFRMRTLVAILDSDIRQLHMDKLQTLNTVTFSVNAVCPCSRGGAWSGLTSSLHPTALNETHD